MGLAVFIRAEPVAGKAGKATEIVHWPRLVGFADAGPEYGLALWSWTIGARWTGVHLLRNNAIKIPDFHPTPYRNADAGDGLFMMFNDQFCDFAGLAFVEPLDEAGPLLASSDGDIKDDLAVHVLGKVVPLAWESHRTM